MLPTLAERLREQQARSRGRKSSHQPWPVPHEPPTALLFQVPAELVSQVEPAVGLPLPASQAGVIETATPALPEPEPAATVAPRPATERPLIAELLLLVVWAVLVVIDGALALASLIDGASRRQRRRPGIALMTPPAPPLLVAAAAP
jgi:hypothetical protein